MEMKEQKGQDTAIYPESEGYIADDETRPETTALDHHGHGGFNNHSAGDKFFSKLGHKLGEPRQEEAKNADAAPQMKFGQEMLAAPEEQPANKGVGSSELGTGYEADAEETINSAVVPKYDEGVKVPSFGGSDLDSGYEEGSEGSFSHPGNLSDFSFKEEKPGVLGGKRQLDS